MDSQNAYELVAGLTLIGVAAGYVFWQSISSKTKLKKANSTSTPAAPGQVHAQPLTQNSANRPKNQLSILQADDLFARTNTSGLVETIRTRLGLSPENFKSDVLPVLRTFAEYVQLLPASESHHHAQPGGLLQHTLEVAANALAIRQGYKLPTGAPPEDQIRQAPLWSFGVLIAALLHDVGKPVADVIVEFYGDNVQKSCGKWNGLVGGMNAQAVSKQASFYTVQFPVSKDYDAHQRLPVTLLHAIVPAQALQWLGGDDRLLQELFAYLGNNDKVATVIKEIIVKADSLSVAENLKLGSRIRFASARSLPMIERLMQGLRTLLTEGHVAINRPGAPVFIDPDGVHLWIVAGTAADQVRKLLESREERVKGAAGIPSDNTRIFDTWSEYGSLLSPPKEYGKGSVWWVKIQIGDWSHVLTCLKFRLDVLFLPGTTMPAPLEGMVTPVEPTNTRIEVRTEVRSGQNPQVSDSQQAMVDAKPDLVLDLNANNVNYDPDYIAIDATNTTPTATYSPDDAGLCSLLVSYDGNGNPLPAQTSSETTDARASNLSDSLPVSTASYVLPQEGMLVSGANSHSVANNQGLNAPKVSQESQFLDEPDSVGAVKNSGLTVPKTVQAFSVPKAPPRALFKQSGTTTRINADKFMSWIQQGLGDGSLTYNESDAMIHFVPAGMALVSPKIFKTYLESNTFEGPTTISPETMLSIQKKILIRSLTKEAQDAAIQKEVELSCLQKEIQKGGYIGRNPSNKSSFFMYRVQQSDGSMSVFRLTTYLVPNPQAYIRPVPSPNPLLKSSDDEGK